MKLGSFEDSVDRNITALLRLLNEAPSFPHAFGGNPAVHLLVLLINPQILPKTQKIISEVLTLTLD
jgi:hypothetical protein